MKGTSIVLLALLFSGGASFAADLQPLPYPEYPSNADSASVASVNRCYDQANKRRALGIDTHPVFKGDADQEVDPFTYQGHITCFAHGTSMQKAALVQMCEAHGYQHLGRRIAPIYTDTRNGQVVDPQSFGGPMSCHVPKVSELAHQ